MAVETESFDYYLQEFVGLNCDQPFAHAVHYFAHTAVWRISTGTQKPAACTLCRREIAWSVRRSYGSFRSERLNKTTKHPSRATRLLTDRPNKIPECCLMVDHWNEVRVRTWMAVMYCTLICWLWFKSLSAALERNALAEWWMMIWLFSVFQTGRIYARVEWWDAEGWEEVEVVVPHVLYQHLPAVFDGNHESRNRDRWCVDQWFPVGGPRNLEGRRFIPSLLRIHVTLHMALFLHPVLGFFWCVLLLWLIDVNSHTAVLWYNNFCHRVFSGILETIGTTMGQEVAQFVEALRCKPDGRGFHSWWRHWNFSLS